MATRGERLGWRIQRLRNAMGWRASDLARASRLSPSQISALERGKRKAPGADTVNAVAAALGTTYDDLYRDLQAEPEPSPPRQALAEGSPLERLLGVQTEVVYVQGREGEYLRNLAEMFPVPVPIASAAPGYRGELPEGVIVVIPPRESKNFERYYISGDCMEPEIPDGCEVWVDKTLHPEDGDVVVVQLESELLCKRVDHSNGHLRLTCDNGEIREVVLPEGADNRLLGVVVSIAKRVRRGHARGKARPTAVGASNPHALPAH